MKWIDSKLIILSLLAFFPSFSAIQKVSLKAGAHLGINDALVYCGALVAILAYILFGAYILFKIKSFIRSDSILKRKFSMAGVVSVVVLLFVLFSVIYPHATSGAFGGGSDRDEALNIAVTALLHGKYPYYEKTYVPGKPHEMGVDGNRISPFPGELLISIPFVILGNGAYQTFFWILFAAFFINILTRNNKIAFFTTLSACLLSVGSIYEIVSGGDLLVNGIWVFIPFLGISLLNKNNDLWLYLVAVFLGLAFSTRPNFILIAPFFLGFCAARFENAKVIQLTSIVAISFLIVTAPFFLYDADAFSPLHAYNKLGRYDIMIPYIGMIVPLFAFFIAAFLTHRLYKGNCPLSYWFLCMGIVLFIPVLTATILDSFSLGHLSFIEYSWYGLSYIYFIIFGFLFKGMDTPLEN